MRLSASSALVISGADVSIRGLDLDGAMVVEAGPGARVVIDGARVRNGGWRWQALKPEKPMTEEQSIRCALGPCTLAGDVRLPVQSMWRRQASHPRQGCLPCYLALLAACGSSTSARRALAASAQSLRPACAGASWSAGVMRSSCATARLAPTHTLRRRTAGAWKQQQRRWSGMRLYDRS